MGLISLVTQVTLQKKIKTYLSNPEINKWHRVTRWGKTFQKIWNIFYSKYFFLCF